MEPNLKGKRIAILATDGVEQVELERPRKSLDDAGAVTILVAPNDTEIQAFRHHDKGDRLEIVAFDLMANKVGKPGDKALTTDMLSGIKLHKK